jgi:DNA-binding transcriptional LysR family regulator
MLDRFLRTAEARLLRTVEVDTVLGTLDLIAHTEWVTIFPAVMVLRDVMESDHVVNPLYGPELSSEIYLVRRSSDELGEASLAFAESLSQRAALMARRATKLAQAS